MKYGQTIVFCGLVLPFFICCASSTSNTPDGHSSTSNTASDQYRVVQTEVINTSGEQPIPSQTGSGGNEVSPSPLSVSTNPSFNDSGGNESPPTLPVPTNPYFSGSGGRGMTLAILVPESTGLNENQAYLPRMVQGVLVSNISKYSAISVLDRVSLDRVITETLDPTYEDNLDIVRLGHIAQVGHMMTGNITRTFTGYALQINITETTPDAKTIASFSGTSTVAQFDDFSAIHRASRELLEQMGVELTEAAKNELDRGSSSQEIRAQTNLAQGIVAQEGGTVVEAMVHYYNAVSFDSQLSEAAGRLSSLSSTISGGNIGENVRNDIQRRNEWMKILTEAENFFSRNLPFELVYSNSLAQGRIDYARETVELISSIELRPSNNSFEVFSDILVGLEGTGRRKEWGLEFWPVSATVLFSNQYYARAVNERTTAEKRMDVALALVDENGKVISEQSVNLRSRIQFARSNTRIREGHELYWAYGRVIFDIMTGGYYIIDTTKLEVLGVTQAQADDYPFLPSSRNPVNSSLTKRQISFTVNANDITDRLTIRIVSVDGIDIERNPNYIRVIAEN